MHEEIANRLAALEAERGFRVLYACESGSRAWGFASHDSDWDVRFFYVWPPREYLRVRLPVDHVHRDLPGDLDITGWDMRKALHHASKSSASVLEWLGSPLVYFEHHGVAAEMRQLARGCFRVKPTVHHYLGLARQLWAQAGEGESLNGKKCLYVMRATLCARWALTRGSPPPVAFTELLPLIGIESLREEILRFVMLKKAGGESDEFPVGDALRAFLDDTRAGCEVEQVPLTTTEVDLGPLDDFFQRTVESWK